MALPVSGSNHKNELKEYLQTKLLPLPTYKTEEVSTNPTLFKSKVQVNGKVFETTNPVSGSNHKNELQEYLQRKLLPLPTYKTEEVSTNPTLFKSKVQVNGKVFETTNVYRRKKIAEQEVAKFALTTLHEGDDNKEYEIIKLTTPKIGDEEK